MVAPPSAARPAPQADSDAARRRLQMADIARLAGVATRVVHMAPPPTEGQVEWWRDPRTLALVRVLRRRTPPASLAYGSTSGVYGDCGGDLVDESRPVAPSTPRATTASPGW